MSSDGVLTFTDRRGATVSCDLRDSVVDLAALRMAIAARHGGATLRASAKAGNISVATLCRWQVRYPDVKEALDAALRAGYDERIEMEEAIDAADEREADRRFADRLRPGVPIHPLCPQCGAAVEVRSWLSSFYVRFWRCSRWKHECSFRSWRPRHPSDCPHCGAARLWSHSRRSVVCSGCGMRTGVA